MSKQKTFSAKVSEETAALVQGAFERSGAFTKDEFLRKMINNENEKTLPEVKSLTEPIIPEPVIEITEPEVFKPLVIEVEQEVLKPQLKEIEPKLERNEILISLNPEQLFALRETVLSSEHFASEQNKKIDGYSNEKGRFYSETIYDLEFSGIWVRYQEMTKYITEDQKESIIKHNMAAFLLNVFYFQLIEGNLSDSVVTAKSLKAYIQKSATVKPLTLLGNRKPVQSSNEQIIDPLTIEVERKLKSNEIIIALNPVQLYAFSETVLGSEDFAAEHNSRIDDIYNDNRPFFYFGNLYDSEFHGLWVRFIEIPKNTTEDQREFAIKHNMVAFLLNVFYIQLLMGNTDSVVTAKNLKAYIQENSLTKPSNSI